MYIIIWIKYIDRFHVAEESIVETSNTLINIPPHSLYALIVDTLSYNHRASAWSSKWVVKEIHGNINIFPPFVNSNTGW